MKNNVIGCACLVFLLMAVCNADPYGNQFADTDLSIYLTNPKAVENKVAFVDESGMTGLKCLKINTDSILEFKPVPVNEKTKYTLSFHTKFAGGEALDENPKLDLTMQITTLHGLVKYGFLPQVAIKFFNKDNTLLTRDSFSTAIPFRNWQLFKTTFYPPYCATSMQLVVSSGKNTKELFIDNLKFDATVDQGAINVNPVTNESGLYDYSAWRGNARGSAMITKDDGKVAYHTAYSNRGSRFPLAEKREYTGYTKATAKGYAPMTKVYFYDKNNKKLGEVNIWRKTTFTTPVGCVSGVIGIRSLVVDEVRVYEGK